VRNWHHKYEYLQEFQKENFENYKNSLLSITNKSLKYFTEKEFNLESFYHYPNELNREKSHHGSNSLDGFLKPILLTTKDRTSLEFAHLARLGFMAISLLRTAVENEILNQNRVNDFLNTIPSVSSRMLDDAFAVKMGKLSYVKFSSIYGHLRPGTYDISTNNYSQDADFYLKPLIDNADKREMNFFELSRDEKVILDEKLSAIGLALNSEDFLNFARTAIAAREWCKFSYSRSISAILESIKEWGTLYNLTTNELRHINLNSLLNENQFNRTSILRIKDESQQNALDFKINFKIELPDFITSETNLFASKLSENTPSFPTMLNTRGSILILNSSIDIKAENLNGVVVAMESADPGYDFILGNSISGIITAYGGPNSHMAIRCSELGIPAVIGIGIEQFRKLRRSHKIEIDSVNKVWRIIN
jgi:phosphohistidine swiveling domain-containing protein